MGVRPGTPAKQNHRIALIAALLAISALGVVAAPDRAASARPRVVVLGRGTSSARPQCPAKLTGGCEAIGRVTGFQLSAGAERGRFLMPFLGRIVAWSLKVAKPSRSESVFFNRLFDNPPQARLSVLRRVGERRPPRFELIRQGPRRNLKPYRGGDVVFTIEHPLWARRGDIVALTVPTWAPVLSTGGGGRWLASRKPGRCQTAEQQRRGHPQQGRRTVRRYGCRYAGGRLTYTATAVRAARRHRRPAGARRVPG